MRPAGAGGPGQPRARVGRVTRIDVAEVTVPGSGTCTCTIDFHVKNPKLDERMTLADFRAQ